MHDKILAVLLLAFLPSVSYAQGPQDYQCTNGNLQRRVEILYEAGGSVPCEVHYFKDTQGDDERQVLWRALNETGYCERKAREFVVKLEDMGWNCSQGAAGAQKEEPQIMDDAEPVLDDTDALLPGDKAEPTGDM